MPGDVIIFHGLDAHTLGNTSMYNDILPSYGGLGGLGGLVPSVGELRQNAMGGLYLAISIGGLLTLDRIIQKQFRLSSKVMPVVHLVAGAVVGRAVSMWFSPMLGMAVAAAGAALAVIKGLQSWAGISIGMSGFGDFSEGLFDDDDFAGLDDLDMLDAIEVEALDGYGAFVPEFAAA